MNWKIVILIFISVLIIFFNSCSTVGMSTQVLRTGDLAFGVSLNITPIRGEVEMIGNLWWGYGLGNDYDLFLSPDIIWSGIYLILYPITGEKPYGIQSMFSLEVIPPFAIRKNFINGSSSVSAGIAVQSGYVPSRIGFKNFGIFGEWRVDDNRFRYSGMLFTGWQQSYSAYRYDSGINLSLLNRISHYGRIDRQVQYYSTGIEASLWLLNFTRKENWLFKDIIFDAGFESIGKERDVLRQRAF